MKDPAFMFYSKNWIEGTADLFPDEKGVYIDLLCHQHQRGSLPNDTKRLARLVGLSQDEFEKIWSSISNKFEANGEAIANRTLKRVMEERADKGETNAIIGAFAQIHKRTLATFEEKELIKKQFNYKDFKGIERGKLSERLSEWYSERYRLLVNVNVDVISNSKKGEKAFLLNDIDNPAFIFMFNECVDGRGKLQDMKLFKNEYACLIANNEALIKRLPAGSDSYNLIKEFIIDNSVTMQEWESPADLFKHFLNWSRKRVKA